MLLKKTARYCKLKIVHLQIQYSNDFFILIFNFFKIATTFRKINFQKLCMEYKGNKSILT